MCILRGFNGVSPKRFALSNTSHGQSPPTPSIPPHHQSPLRPPKKVLLILGESKLGLVLKSSHFTKHNFMNWSSQSLNVLKCTLSVLKNMHSYPSLASFSADKVSQLHIYKPHIFTCNLQPSDMGLQSISRRAPIKTPSFQSWASC